MFLSELHVLNRLYLQKVMNLIRWNKDKLKPLTNFTKISTVDIDWILDTSFYMVLKLIVSSFL